MIDPQDYNPQPAVPAPTLREFLSQSEGDEFILMEPAHYDEAIVGVAQRLGMPDAVCYSRSKLIQILVRDGLSPEEAEEFFEFNIAGAYVGPSSPIFIDTPAQYMGLEH